MPRGVGYGYGLINGTTVIDYKMSAGLRAAILKPTYCSRSSTGTYPVVYVRIYTVIATGGKITGSKTGIGRTIICRTAAGR